VRVTVLIPIAHLPSYSSSLIFHFAVDRRHKESSIPSNEAKIVKRKESVGSGGI